jgi:Tol biopolymer transport system component
LLALLATASANRLSAIELVSTMTDGTQGSGGATQCAISGNGRYIAFTSAAADLVPDDTNNHTDIFVKDRSTGVLERVSVNASGGQASGVSSQGYTGSFDSSISADGRYVAFASAANNLIPDDLNNRTDIFVKDRQTGAVRLVSVTSAGVQASGECTDPDISADGRYVVFNTQSNNLTAGTPSGNHQIYWKDLQTGAIERVSVDAVGEPLMGSAYESSVSGDGNLVVFMLEQFFGSGGFQIYQRNVSAGTTSVISLNTAGEPGNSESTEAVISRDGRRVVFRSRASDLVESDTNFSPDIFVRDLQTSTTVRVSVASNGTESAGSCYNPALSDDGRFAVFRSAATTLVAGDLNDRDDIFLHDLQTGETVRVSVADGGTEGNGGSLGAKIAGSGATVAFISSASNLVPADSNDSNADVFVAVNPLFVAVRRPDGLISSSASSPRLGDGIYNATGTSQTLVVSSRRASRAGANFTVENDGNLGDSFRVRATPGSRLISVTYLDPANRTAEVITGSYITRVTDPGGTSVVSVNVVPNRKALHRSIRRQGKLVKVWKRATQRCLLTATSVADGSKADTVLFQVNHR